MCICIVGVAMFGLMNSGVAILLPCTNQDLMAAILAQSAPRLLCACANASDVTSVLGISSDIRVFEERVEDTINKVLKQNNVEKTFYISNSCEYLGSDIIGLQINTPTHHPMIFRALCSIWSESGS